MNSPMELNRLSLVSAPRIAQKTASPQTNPTIKQTPAAYCRCATTSMAIHLSHNNLNNCRDTYWGALGEFSLACTQGSAKRYRWGLWAHKHLSLHRSKPAGQPQHHPDVSLYPKDQLTKKKKNSKQMKRKKTQTCLLSIVRKTVPAIYFKEHKLHAKPDTSQINTAS